MTNQFAVDLRNEIKQRFSIDAVNMPYSDWVCKNTTLKSAPFNFKKFPFQKAIVDDLHPNLHVMKISQAGLALALDTPILTTNGWKTIETLVVGDKVYGSRGLPCEVTYKSPIHVNRDCYEVEFCDGERIVTDGKHRWVVNCERMFNEEGLYPRKGRMLPHEYETYARRGIINTETMLTCYTDGVHNIFSIPVTEPLVNPKKVSLPLDPYLFGLWLGDGHSYSANITALVEDAEEYAKTLTAKGFNCRVTPEGEKTVTLKPELDLEKFKKVYSTLNHLGVLRNKHFPRLYLETSVENRLELLQGLMDTDGTIDKRGRPSFSNTNPQIVEGFLELVRSLGFKPRIRWREVKSSTLKSGHVIHSKLPCAEVSFMSYADLPVFKLPRKLARLKEDGRRTEAFNRRIVGIHRVDSVLTQCITVDSDDHLYLAGRGLIATHNTEVQIRKAAAFCSRNQGVTVLLTFPDEAMMKRNSQTRIMPIIDSDKVFNLSGGKPIRSMDIQQIGNSYLMVVPATEKSATSTPADFIMVDEVDLSNQQMLGLLGSRLQASEFKIFQSFSTPTFEGVGISQSYQTTDRREYFIKCDCCNHWQLPLFTKDFIQIDGLPDEIKLTDIDTNIIDKYELKLNAVSVTCEKCFSPLDLTNGKREWIAEFPHRDLARGYRVRPFSVNTLSPAYIISELIKYRDKDFLRGWYNTVLGETFEESATRLTEAELNPCFKLGEAGASSEDHFIGIDVGSVCHITVCRSNGLKSGVEYVEFITVTDEALLDKVEELDKKYRFAQGTMDKYPEQALAKTIFDLTNGRIIPVQYAGSVEIADKVDTQKTLQVDRTEHIDTLANLIRKGLAAFYNYGQQKETIKMHLRDMVREKNGEKNPIWRKLTGKDHYFHSMAYATTAVKYYRGDFTGYKEESAKTALYYGGTNIGRQTTNLWGHR